MRWTARDTIAAIGALVVVGVLRLSGCGTDGTWGGLDPGGIEPGPIDTLLGSEGASASSTLVDFSRLPRDLDRWATHPTDGDPDPMLYLYAAFERCGTVDLAAFDGSWTAPTDHPEWAGAMIADGRIEAGSIPRSEHCAVHVLEQTATRIVAVSVDHEDVDDPGDAWLSYLRLERAGDRLTVCTGPDLDRLDASCVDLARAAP